MSEATDAPDRRMDEISAVADQRMLKARVVRQNFTLLYQHLAVADILPTLVEKGIISEAKRKKVEAYGQKYAQNILVIQALFSSTCPPDGLVRLTDVLAMTPGQEQVARMLLHGEDVIPSSCITSEVHSQTYIMTITYYTMKHCIHSNLCPVVILLELEA